MATPHLTAVPQATADSAPIAGEVVDLGRAPETAAQRIRRLQQEARGLAREHIAELARDVAALAARAEEVAGGGEAYPAGVRDVAARMAAELAQKVNLLTGLMDRAQS